MSGFIERTVWKEFLEEFSKRNQLRPTRLEVYGDKVEVQEDGPYLPLLDVSYDAKGSRTGSLEIKFGGEMVGNAQRLTHLVENVERITPLLGTTMVEEGLGIEDDRGSKILLRFETLPELPEETTN